MNKLQRKLNKLQHTVFKETHISCSLKPSNYLVICNAGLTNGLSEETILEHFLKCGSLTDIILLPGKSCCFLSYTDLRFAQLAFETYNGKLNIAQNGKPIYLLYAECLPEIDISSKTWNDKPPGLIVLENFITEEEESFLLKVWNFDTHSDPSKNLKHRQVKHLGYEFRYDINNVDKDKPLSEHIPKEYDFLWKKLKDSEFEQFYPNQLTINHYSPGQGIPQHVDTHSAFEDPIMSLSLLSAVVMEFKKDNKHLCVLLPKRSLCIMSGECRYEWSHGITPRKLDVINSENGFNLLKRNTRISFTFRKILPGECNCNYKAKCDSFIRLNNQTRIHNVLAAELEKVHVHDVYENITNHFSETRHKPWPNVLDFVNSFDTGSILVDIGCGNGKYLNQNERIFNVGCDTSLGLINVCRERGLQTFLGSCLNVPIKDNFADGCICIAVIHHLANQERRRHAVSEIIRILKPQGKALIYVWAKDQHKDKQRTSYIKQDRKNRRIDNLIDADTYQEVAVLNAIKLPVHVNRTQFKFKDVLVPWNLKTENKSENTFLRYYHVFEESELEELCANFNSALIEKSYYDQGNWCVIIRKK